MKQPRVPAGTRAGGQFTYSSVRLVKPTTRCIIRINGKEYNPAQPRVPAGDPRGGQWTSDSPGSVLEGSNLDRKRLSLSGGKEVTINGERYVVLYHGTSADRLDSIIKNGLQPKSVSGVGHQETLESGGVYMTGYEPAATGFAETMASRAGGQRAVISALVPVGQVKGPPEWPEGIEKYYEVISTKPIPSSHIIGAFRAKRGKQSWDLATDYEDIL